MLNHYRPIGVSTTFKKILEMYIQDKCGHYEFDDSRLGYVAGQKY